MKAHEFAPFATACKKLWLEGKTLVEIGHKFSLPAAGMANAISKHFGIPVKELKDLRLANRVQGIFEKLLPTAVETGFIPLRKEIYALCNSSPEISRRVVLLFKNAGYAERKAADDGLIKAKLSKAERIMLLQERSLALVQQLDRMPYSRELKQAGIRKKQFQKYAHPWLKSLGYTPLTGGSGPRRHTNEQILQILRDMAQQLGRTPGCKDMKDAHGINAPTLSRYFGSIRQAQIQAGLKPNTRGAQLGNQHGSQRKYTNELLLESLRQISQRVGRTATMQEIKEYARISPNQYTKYFGSFTKAQELAGLTPRIKRSKEQFTDT